MINFLKSWAKYLLATNILQHKAYKTVLFLGVLFNLLMPFFAQAQTNSKFFEDIFKKSYIIKHTAPPKNQKDEKDQKDLHFLTKILANKQIVVMGEATHGTKEFSDLKHRVFKQMVLQNQTKIFGLEANFSACQQLNAYLCGQDTLHTDKEMLKSIYSIIWETEEMLEFIAWIRTYNKTQSPDNQVHFYGFDMQQGYEARNFVLRFLKKTDSLFHAKIADTLQFANVQKKQQYQMLPTLALQIRSYMKENKDTLIAKSSLQDWLLAYQHTEILWQQLNFQRLAKRANTNHAEFRLSIAYRDSCMAANVNWILEYEKQQNSLKGKKNSQVSKPTSIFLWMHNGHASIGGDPDYGLNSVTARLKQQYADSLYSIGFDFVQGEFRAFDSRYNTLVFRALEDTSNFSSNLFGSLATNKNKKNKDFAGLFIDFSKLINFEKVQKNDKISILLTQSFCLRDVGVVYLPTHPNKVCSVLPTLFDALLIVKDTKASVSLAQEIEKSHH
jgi:erythromycin esterase